MVILIFKTKSGGIIGGINNFFTRPNQEKSTTTPQQYDCRHPPFFY